MRRVLVIFLILLFPLNVFALSMSVASLPHDHVAALAGSVDADAADSSAGASAATDCETSCDIDPDEPPSGAELHYIIGHALAPPFAGPSAAAFPPHDADRHHHFIAPPIKPPRAA